MLELALARTDLSPRELACRFTEEQRYFVSESSVYRLLKAADLITSPAYVLMSASDAFKNPTTRVHEMWQTDFTYFRIVLDGLRGEQSVAELCRREGIAANLYYRWSKDFLEAGKKQLAGDTVREATSDEVKDLRAENRELKEVVAEITLKNRVLKKSLTGAGEEDAT